MHPALGTLFGLGYTFLMSERALVASAIRRSDDAVKDVALRWAHTLCARSGVRVHARGLDHAKWNRALVVAANHQSLFDIPVILAATGRPLGFLTKRELFSIPAFGKAIQRLGCVSIDRGDPSSARESIRIAAQRVRNGASLVVFPEGTRSANGELLPFKKGPFYLIQAAQVPALPMAIIGTTHVLKKNGVLVRPADVEVRVGEPLYCEGSSAQARETLCRQVREAIGSLMER